jgi:hypothetical protein
MVMVLGKCYLMSVFNKWCTRPDQSGGNLKSTLAINDLINSFWEVRIREHHFSFKIKEYAMMQEYHKLGSNKVLKKMSSKTLIKRT